MDFFHQFTATHFVWLAGIACFGYLAKTVGKQIARHLLSLIDNLEKLGPTMAKTEIMWEKTADAQMWNELERRGKAHAKGV